MALINLQTNLKSLTYEAFGSQSPLITKDINRNPSVSGLSLEGEKRTDDFKRITKLLTSTPAALKFAANQAALNTLEQRIKSNKKGSLAGDILRGAGNTAKVLASTLAQVPVSGTGTHFIKGFAGKLGYLPGTQGHVEYKNNRNQDGQIDTIGKIEKSGDFESSKSRIVLDYFTPNQNGKNKKQQFIDGTIVERKGSTNYPLIGLETTSSFSSVSMSYYPTEDSGLRQTNTFDPKFVVPAAIGTLNDKTVAYDTITARLPVTGSINDESILSMDEENEDLIKFNFKIITPTDGEPNITYLSFRAFLDSLSDDFGANWNSFNYVGRAEQFHTYGGFNRSLSFSFKVAALSKQELAPLYKKLNLLAGSQAPTYVGSSFMRGNFVAVTIGDYIVNQTGFFSSVGLSWNNNYPFGPGIGETEGEVPHILDVSCAFTPIHNFNTTFGKDYFNVKNPDQVTTLL
jgi:hypothetical protein